MRFYIGIYMTLTFNLDIHDWMAFQKHYLDHSKEFRRTKRIIAWVVPLVMSFFVVIDLYKGEFNIISAVVLSAFAVAWLLLYPKRLTSRTLKKAKKMIEEGDNTSFLGPQELVLTEEGLLIKLKDSEQKMGWKAIKKIEQTDAHLFLYNSAISAIIIPKLKLHADLKELETLLRSKVG